MGGGIRIGSIGGIEIHLDWSLLIIFFLVASSLGAGVFPFWHPDWNVLLVWAVAFAAAALLIVSVLLHELSHALVGRAQGIDIRRITLFVFGGMAHLEREPHAWRAELAMAIVGPFVSLAIGIACVYAAGLSAERLGAAADDPAQIVASLGPVATVLMWLGPVNIALGLFNLVPGFPLDGGRVLRAVLWGATGDLERATRWASGMGQAVAWVLIACGFAMILGLRVPFFGTGLLPGLWIALIGWFLNNAAMLSYRQLIAQRTLEGVPVSRVMLAQPATIDPEAPVAALVDDLLMKSDQRAFPVVRDGRLVGLVSFDDVRKVDAAARGAHAVKEIMTPADALAVVDPEEPAADALRRFSRGTARPLPVVRNGVVRGLLRQEDILKWLALHGEREVPA